MRRIIFIILCLFLLTITPVFAVNRPGEAPFNTWNFDQWNTRIPSPHGYIPSKAIAVEGRPQDLFIHNNEVYLLTSNNIFVYDTNGIRIRQIELSLNDVTYETQLLTGIFVNNDFMYITDFDAGEIIKADLNGDIIRIFGEPQSDFISPGTLFRPSKIVVDDFERIFVQVFGVFEGIYSLTSDGEFINFFGANHVDMTLTGAIQQLWRRILTLEQRRAMAAFVPIEYSNLFIDTNGFIFATVTTGMSPNNPNMIRQLNPLGVNVLPPQTVHLANASFADITVDSYGVMTVIDQQWGMIIQTDRNGRLMFGFGGLGNQLGLFSRPIAIIEVNGNLWVLDELKRNITIFEITEFGQNVHAAMRLHNEGRYLEGIDIWNQVIRYNANYLLAYQGLGLAYFQLEDFSRARNYFRLAGDRTGYSEAFSELSLLFMRENFGWFFLGAMAILTMFIIKNRKKGGAA